MFGCFACNDTLRYIPTNTQRSCLIRKRNEIKCNAFFDLYHLQTSYVDAVGLTEVDGNQA